MALPDEPFFDVLVETFDSGPVSGRHGTKHVRPVAGQGLDRGLVVECSREMREQYPTETMFIIKVKLSNRKGGSEYLKSPSTWGYTVVTKTDAQRFLAKLESSKAK